MKIALLDVKQSERDPSNSITVAYRNMLEISRAFGADLYANKSDLSKARDDYDVIVCGFGSMSTEKEKSTEFLLKNKKAALYWLVGEYEQSTFSPLFYCKKPYTIIKNFHHLMTDKRAISQVYLPFNSLLFDVAAERREPSTATYGPVYYGRWRQGRSPYFLKYLQHGVYLSTSTKNMKQFMHLGCSPFFSKSFAWKKGREALRRFSASLYIEDVFTHTHYNGLANRWYEALNCYIPLAIDRQSLPTFQTHGTQVPEWWVVDSHQELIDFSISAASDRAKNIEAIEMYRRRAREEKKYVIESLSELFFGGMR
jgi:hypothetical protein